MFGFHAGVFDEDQAGDGAGDGSAFAARGWTAEKLDSAFKDGQLQPLKVLSWGRSAHNAEDALQTPTTSWFCFVLEFGACEHD